MMMSIFRSYDVRGIYGKDIDENIMKKIGAAFFNVYEFSFEIYKKRDIKCPTYYKTDTKQ